jgi:hypothetical protein
MSAGVAAMLGVVLGGNTPALAASDNDPRTYAGDYQGGSLPIGTAIISQYFSYAHADAFVDPTGRTLPGSHADTWIEFTRATYFTEFANHPLVLEADLPFATLTNVNIPGTNSAVKGGIADPVLHFTYFLITDAQVQRWLGFTSFFGFRRRPMTIAVRSMSPRRTSSPSRLRSATRKDLESFRQA